MAAICVAAGTFPGVAGAASGGIVKRALSPKGEILTPADNRCPNDVVNEAHVARN